MNTFVCKICGNCCKGNGSVFLYPEDIIKISENLSMTIQEVVDKYTEFVMMEIIEKSGSYSYLPFLILKKSKGSCLFMNSNYCEIHQFKPFQCENTPFVSEFFSDETWRKELKKMCPAMKNMNDKDFLNYHEIGEKSERMEQNYYLLLKENSFSLEKILGVKLGSPSILTYHD